MSLLENNVGFRRETNKTLERAHCWMDQSREVSINEDELDKLCCCTTTTCREDDGDDDEPRTKRVKCIQFSGRLIDFKSIDHSKMRVPHQVIWCALLSHSLCLLLILLPGIITVHRVWHGHLAELLVWMWKFQCLNKKNPPDDERLLWKKMELIGTKSSSLFLDRKVKRWIFLSDNIAMKHLQKIKYRYRLFKEVQFEVRFRSLTEAVNWIRFLRTDQFYLYCHLIRSVPLLYNLES